MARFVSVVETPTWLSRAERLMTDEERSAVVDSIAANPRLGVVVPGTGGLRKARIPLAGRGKRGGGRIVYWFHAVDYPAVLSWFFAKNDADDLTASQRHLLAGTTEDLLADFKRRT